MSKLKLFVKEKIKTPKGLIIAVFLSLLFLYITHGIYVWMYSESTDNAYVDGDITFISPEVNGVVEKINFTENQLVTKGATLLKINDTNLKAQYEQAVSALERVKLNIGIIDTKIQLAELTLEKATKEFNRTSKLAQNNFSSKKLYEEAEFAKNSAQINLRLLRSEKQAGILQLSESEDLLNIAQNNFSNTIITAPFDGIVTSSSARIGGYARIGVPIFALVPSNNYYVRANFKETQISNFKIGMPAEISFDTLHGKVISGKIISIYPATGAKFTLIPTDNATGNFTKIVQRVPVIIEVYIPDEYKNKIGVGYSAHVSVRIDK